MMVPANLTIARNLEAAAVLYDQNDPDCVATRLGGLLKLYFLNNSPAKREQFFKVAEDYLAIPGCRVTHYMSDEGRRRRMAQPHRVPDYFLSKEPDPENADARIDVYEELGGDYYAPPCWHLHGDVFGVNFQPYKLSGLEAHFPPDLMTRDADRLAELALRWVEQLGAIHGSFGFGVLGTPGSENSTGPYWYPWLQAYPLVDQGSLGVYWSASRRGGYDQPFTSNWLTILGDANIEKLGGKGEIRERLGQGMSFLPFKGGAIIRACETPALGNAASGGIPEGYRTAARIIKPIRFEGYQRGIIKTPKELGFTREQDLQVTLDWVRRFD
ncbi:uncharacterized protein DUF3396 [Rhodobacter sp. JA431]|uniref:type VI immunity family protein n=1 Tax=Rhodobacter sp. JA431 TaxID=570013 RepID=UPI000BDDE736|nr:type VI immunity family protein [Rhodobacter sp. JA431]SOC04245.1 uncharacterized protein DUF3396 [Rhodobacter sp. JA431]